MDKTVKSSTPENFQQPSLKSRLFQKMHLAVLCFSNHLHIQSNFIFVTLLDSDGNKQSRPWGVVHYLSFF